MSNIKTNLHRDDLFRNFMYQKGIEWDKIEGSGIVGVSVDEIASLWKHLFNNTYADVSNKRMGLESKYYIECREFICKNW